MGVALPELARRLLDENTFVTVSTINPNGYPQASVVWVKRDGDEIVFSTILGRRKTLNMQRDPRVAVSGFDPADAYRYFEVRGTVTIDPEGGRELIDELSLKYQGTPFRTEDPDVVRVVCRVSPEKIFVR